MNPQPNDADLARRARGGDRDALATLVERTRMRLFSLAYAELRHYEDAQDAVAAALHRICLHIEDLRDPERIAPWMNSIVRNEARKLRSRPRPDALSLDSLDDLTDHEAFPLLLLDIEHALRRVPGEQARAMRMFYLGDVPIREIAARLGRSEGTVKSWLHRGRRQLAQELEGYFPMSQTAPMPDSTLHEAALLQTDLDPTLIQKIGNALNAGGYRLTAIPRDERTRLLDAFRRWDFRVLDEWLKRYSLLLFDEWIDGRSAFEYLINAITYAQSRGDQISETKVGLLLADPSEFTVLAAHNLGVDGILNKNRPDELAQLSQPILKRQKTPSHSSGGWQRFTERARRVVFFAQEEAAKFGENYVGTEHLLLGLLRERDHVGAKILTRLGISMDRLDEETRRRATRGNEGHGPMLLTPLAKTSIDHAYDEAKRLGNNYIGTEHLLLGLIRTTEGLAGMVLAEMGANMETARVEVRTFQAEAAT